MNIKKNIFFYPAVLLSVAVTVLAACTNAPIFYAIEQEVKLKNFSIKGNVRGFAQIDKTIYTANGEDVFYKAYDSTDAWTALNFPDGLIQGVVADGSVLFAAGAKGGVKYYNGSWNSVPGGENIKMVFGDSTVFGTDYSSIYTVTASGVVRIKGLASGELLTGAGGMYCTTDKGVFKNDGSAVSGAPSSDIISASKGKNDHSLFVLSGKTLYHYDGSAWTSTAIETDMPSCIFYFDALKTVLIGCKKGYTEIRLHEGNDNLTGASEIKPGEAGSTTPKSSVNQYQSVTGSYPLEPVFAAGTKIQYSVFAGAQAGSMERNTGLWAFYSFYKQEWNRE